jgi:hypothetical protein
VETMIQGRGFRGRVEVGSSSGSQKVTQLSTPLSLRER